MRRTRIVTLLVSLALLLGMSGVVSAQEPQFFSNLTTNVNPVYPGNTPDFTIQGTMDFDSNGGGSGYSCLAVALPSSGVAWDTLTTQSATANGSDISGSMGAWTTDGTATGADCHSVGSIAAAPTNTQWWYVRMPSNGTTFQSVVVTVRATVKGNAGSYTIRAAMNDSAFASIGTWLYVDMTGNPMVQNATTTTRYVANNTAQCQGYAPCDTGASGLVTALADATATTIVVLGAYNAAPGTAHTLAGGDTLKGQGGASININGACQSSSPFLTVTGASTIEDLTFDGTCASGNPTAGIAVTAAGATIQNATIQDFANAGVLVSGSGGLTNSGVTYSGNGTGASVTGGTATFDGDTFTNNGTGVAISGGTATVTNGSFSGNTSYGVDHTAGTANIGTAPGDGNTIAVPSGATGIRSVGANATIKDNTISGGSYGIYLNGATASGGIYANTVSGASTQQIGCSGAFTGARFNYIGGNIGGGGSNCSDAVRQLGSPIEAWTDGTSLGECSVTGSGPIFNLGNVAPFGYTPPLGRNSKYYATTSGAVTVTVTAAGGSTQFKMLMNGSGCNPMTSTCWESSTNGRAQSDAGYYFYGTQDPTAITLTNVTARSANRWLPVGLAAVALIGVGGVLLALRRRRYS